MRHTSSVYFYYTHAPQVMSIVPPRGAPPPDAYMFYRLFAQTPLMPFSSSVTLSHSIPLVTVCQLFSGPAMGGTRVAIYGRGFVASATDLLCVFGTPHLVAPLRVLSHTRVECYTPAGHIAGTTAAVTIANSRRPIATGAAFTFDPPMHLLSITPCRGPVEGGSVLSLTGVGFPPDESLVGSVFCKFNSTLVAATFRSEDAIVCVSPKLPTAGYTHVEITVNLHDYTTDGLTFSFEHSRLTALHPSAGPVAGGTSLTVAGVHLAIACLPHGRVNTTDGLLCDVGGQMVAATQLSARSVLCATPPWFGPTHTDGVGTSVRIPP